VSLIAILKTELVSKEIPMRSFVRYAFLLVAFALFIPNAFAQPQRRTELVVSAAASLKDVLTKIGQSYERAHPTIKLRFNFGSSGTLQTQIEQGAPVDLFIAAADKNVDDLIRQKLVDASSRRILAENRLVLIVPQASTLRLKSFKETASAAVTHVGIGGPTVPAGMRAQEVFTKLGIWPMIERKAVRGKDVREVLTQVELGNVEAGVVYATDAAISPQVRIVATAPDSMHKPIRYPLAIVSDSSKQAQASSLARYLTAAPARTTLKQYGFRIR
jgi:molybdate transport system substrate-binding protein